MEDMMRKPRDFDAELKALEDKARDLKARKARSSAAKGRTRIRRATCCQYVSRKAMKITDLPCRAAR